jgi:hypothetical protein
MEDSDLYVPLTEFVYDLDGDGLLDVISSHGRYRLGSTTGEFAPGEWRRRCRSR